MVNVVVAVFTVCWIMLLYTRINNLPRINALLFSQLSWKIPIKTEFAENKFVVISQYVCWIRLRYMIAAENKCAGLLEWAETDERRG